MSEIGVTLAVKENHYNSSGSTLVWTNNSQREYMYGEYYMLEMQISDAWKNMDTVTQDYGFHDIGYSLEGNKVSEMDVDWEWLYGESGTGKYHITKYFTYIREQGDYNSYDVSAEFEIK